MTGLYVHLPFCKRKCAYCDFYSVTETDKMDAYIAALCRDISACTYDDTIDTVFFGGGTPSLLSCENWRNLMGAIRARYPISEDGEITVECNPDSVSVRLLTTLKESGVNRISLGVQGLKDETLRTIGRLHDASSALNAIQLVAQYFDNLNVDYMIGLPHTSVDDVRRDIETLAPYCEHISVYALILEEETPLFRAVQSGEVRLPDDDTVADMYHTACEVLATHGLTRYEISNFAKEARQCRHNLHCWQFHPYLGFGAGAHGFVRGERYHYPCDLYAYIAGAAPTVETADMHTRMQEMIILGLRTTAGVDLHAFRALFGVDLSEAFGNALKDDTVRKSTVLDESHLRIRPEYLYVSNDIMEKFLD